jgi:DNA-binding PucR family transcriptional regulator
MVIDDVHATIREVWSSLQGFLLAARQDPFVLELAGKLNDTLVEEVPELAQNSAVRADLEASTRGLLVAFFDAMTDDPFAPLEVPRAALDLARTMAIHNQDVGPLLRAYRIGQRLAWREVLAMMAGQIADPELRLEVVSFVFDRMSQEVERVVDASVTIFSEERDRRLTGALARRSDMVRAIVRGDAVDWDEATLLLGHRLRRLQVGLQLWLVETGTETDGLRRLEAATHDAAHLLGSAMPLIVPDGSRSLSAWLTVSGDVDLALLGRVSRSAPGVQMAVGLPAYGVNGFRSSHRQSLLARRVAESSEHSSAVTMFEAVEVVSAFLADPDAMRELVTRELGGLGARDEPTRRLRETALAYLRAGGSARDAAEVLGVHKNTVLYRVRGIEEVLGHPIDSRRLTFEIALLIVETLGEGVLPTSP